MKRTSHRPAVRQAMAWLLAHRRARRVPAQRPGRAPGPGLDRFFALPDKARDKLPMATR